MAKCLKEFLKKSKIVLCLEWIFFSRATRPISHCVGRSVGPSVRRSVGPSVPLYFFGVFELFEGRIARVLETYGYLCPCLNHLCPCPTHYCPCPTTRDRGGRVYGLVLQETRQPYWKMNFYRHIVTGAARSRSNSHFQGRLVLSQGKRSQFKLKFRIRRMSISPRGKWT